MLKLVKCEYSREVYSNSVHVMHYRAYVSVRSYCHDSDRFPDAIPIVSMPIPIQIEDVSVLTTGKLVTAKDDGLNYTLGICQHELPYSHNAILVALSGQEHEDSVEVRLEDIKKCDFYTIVSE